MAEEQDHDSLIAGLCDITGLGTEEARSYLEMADWDINQAATSFYTEDPTPASPQAEEEEESEPYTGPRTLDGRPAPQAIPSVGGGASSTSRPRGGVATLGSIGGDSHAGHGHGEDDDSDDEQPRDLFAGGEKSGLAVQDPKRDPKSLIQDIINTAKANSTPNPRNQSAPATSSRFRGAGTTLGGDDAPSRTIPDPQTGRQQPPVAMATRILHIWEDGFSVDDGDLRRFDDPQHAQDLEMIRLGRAPLHLMGVQPGQPVEVELKKHDEKYQKPKRVWKPFGGSGQRLGSPTPGESSTPPVAAPSPVVPTMSSSQVNIDASQPTISLRLQLLDGTRLVSRFNASHTIGDVYDFINRASPGSSSTSWVLATTFPNKDHTDKAAVLGDMAEFKKGGTAVQKRSG